MVLEIPGLGISLPKLLLPVLNLSLEAIVSLLHPGNHLLILSYLHLIILVVIYLTVKL